MPRAGSGARRRGAAAMAPRAPLFAAAAALVPRAARGAAAGACQFVAGTDFQNAAGGAVPAGVTNATGCCAACYADAKCVAGVFAASSGCYLKYAADGAVATAGVVACVTSRTAPLPAPTLPPAPPGVAATTVVSEGRPIFVRVKSPAKPRYGGSAPVVVMMPGGWGAGWGRPGSDADIQTYGYVAVEWLLPGGSDGADPTVASGGDYDVRGPLSASAARDVLLFATGQLADAGGGLITDHAPAANTSIVGMQASSNGGNLALAALGQFGSALPPIAFLSAGESPVGLQYANCEVNHDGPASRSYDLSPFYAAGSSAADGAPWADGFAAALTYDPDSNMTLAMKTGLPNAPRSVRGRLSVRQPGGLRDLVMQEGSDGRMYPSVQLAAAIAEAAKGGLFGSQGWPGWLASEEEAAEWADWRDGLRNVAAASKAQPGLLAIHVQSSHDHACQPMDWPHARSHMLAWHEAGHHWFRFNPDRHYVALLRTDTDSDAFPQNPANDVSVVGWPAIQNTTVPNTRAAEFLQQHELAATLELADRTYTGNLAPTLNAVLVSNPSS